MATSTKKPGAGPVKTPPKQSPAKTPEKKAMPATSSKGCGCASPSGSKHITETASDMTALNDQAIISDILSTEKGLMSRYNVALSEISCDKLRTLVTTKMTECAEDQFDAFLYMNQRNMYPTENAPAPKVAQAKQKYTQKKQQMK